MRELSLTGDGAIAAAPLLFAFLLPLSRAADTFFVILFVLFFAYTLVRDPQRLRPLLKEPFFLLVLLFSGYLTLSLLWSGDPLNGFKYLRQYYWEWLAIGGVALVTVRRPETAHRAVTAFLAGMFVSEILSYGMYFGLWQIRGHGAEYPTPFMMHIDYSVFLAMTAVILLNRLFSSRYTPRQKIVMLLFFLTVAGNLFINKGRTGQAAFLAAMFVAFFLHYRLSFKNLLKITLIAAALFGTAYTVSDRFHSRIDQAVADLKALGKHDFHSSLGLRAAQYVVAERLVKQAPWIGTGVGGRNEAVKTLLQEEDFGFSPFVREFLATHHAHSQYLQTLIEGGVFAFAIMLALLWRLWRLPLQESELRELKTLMVTVFVVASLSEPLWQKQFTNTLFILFSGLLLGRYLSEREGR